MCKYAGLRIRFGFSRNPLPEEIGVDVDRSLAWSESSLFYIKQYGNTCTPRKMSNKSIPGTDLLLCNNLPPHSSGISLRNAPCLPRTSGNVGKKKTARSKCVLWAEQRLYHDARWICMLNVHAFHIIVHICMVRMDDGAIWTGVSLKEGWTVLVNRVDVRELENRVTPSWLQKASIHKSKAFKSFYWGVVRPMNLWLIIWVDM